MRRREDREREDVNRQDPSSFFFIAVLALSLFLSFSLQQKEGEDERHGRVKENRGYNRKRDMTRGTSGREGRIATCTVITGDARKSCYRKWGRTSIRSSEEERDLC